MSTRAATRPCCCALGDARGKGQSTMPPGYKTKLCPMWADKKQRCPYGDRCTFAHGEKELRKAPGAPSKEPEPKHAYLSFPSGDASSKLSEIEEKTGEPSLLGIVKHVRTHLQKASDFSVEWPDPKRPVHGCSKAAFYRFVHALGVVVEVEEATADGVLMVGGDRPNEWIAHRDDTYADATPGPSVMKAPKDGVGGANTFPYLSFPRGDAASKMKQVEETAGSTTLLGIMKYVRTHHQKASERGIKWQDQPKHVHSCSKGAVFKFLQQYGVAVEVEDALADGVLMGGGERPNEWIAHRDDVLRQTGRDDVLENASGRKKEGLPPPLPPPAPPPPGPSSAPTINDFPDLQKVLNDSTFDFPDLPVGKLLSDNEPWAEVASKGLAATLMKDQGLPPPKDKASASSSIPPGLVSDGLGRLDISDPLPPGLPPGLPPAPGRQPSYSTVSAPAPPPTLGGYAKGPLRGMDEAELGVFIYQLGFPQYSPMFVQKCITGADLADPDLCDEDLKDIGVEVALHRRRMLRLIREHEDSLPGAGGARTATLPPPSTMDDEAIDELTCPITLKPYVDPVSTVDGQTYERHAIAAWLEQHNTSPLTGEPLASKVLIPNVALRQIRRSAYPL